MVMREKIMIMKTVMTEQKLYNDDDSEDENDKDGNG